MISPSYTVKQVSALTGVAQATLRAWERRYHIVEPARSGGNYRLYDPTQVAALRHMAALVAAGVPTAQAAQAVLNSSTDSTGELQAAGQHPLPNPDLVATAMSLDPGVLALTVEQALASAAFEHVAQNWLQPQLQRLGAAWVTGHLSVAAEHFASAGLMRALGGLFDQAGAQVSPGAPMVLVGAPPGERHELVLFAFATCLRRLGVNVVYLGADVPVTEWVQAAGRAHQPHAPVTAAVIGVPTARTVKQAQLVVDHLSALHPPVMVWAGGSHRTALTGVHPLPDPVCEAAAYLHLHLRAGGLPSRQAQL